MAVSKCVWLLVARMEMNSNLKTSGRFFQVFALGCLIISIMSKVLPCKFSKFVSKTTKSIAGYKTTPLSKQNCFHTDQNCDSLTNPKQRGNGKNIFRIINLLVSKDAWISLVSSQRCPRVSRGILPFLDKTKLQQLHLFTKQY